MTTGLVSLDVIDVASPCAVPWESMTGDERARFCGECRMHVYNLSDMTRGEAEALISAREGKLCVRFFRRADGTVLTQDCPVGLRAVRRRLARLAACAGGLIALLTTGLALGRPASASSSPTARSPLARLIDWLDPPPLPAIAGKLCVPTPPVVIPNAEGTETSEPAEPSR